MFTGIIEDVGSVKRIAAGADSAVLSINSDLVAEGAKVGDSIAVNGVCLTVTSLGDGGFSADVMHETLSRSGLADLKPGSRVNLERAMPADGRFGGHIVSGHIDGVGRIARIERDGIALRNYVTVKPEIAKYIVEKGSVAIDGVSLTVVSVSRDGFSVSVIPHTAKNTIIGGLRPGDRVNIETDVIGKYVERLLGFGGDKDDTNKSDITREFLAKYGY